MKLTGTNSSTGLIVLIACAHQGKCKALVPTERKQSFCDHPGNRIAVVRYDANDVFITKKKQAYPCTSFSHVALCRPGGHGGAPAPVPIPNTAVKCPCAYGTPS